MSSWSQYVLFTSDVDFVHLVKVVSAGFFTCKAAIFPFVVNKFWGEYFETLQITVKDPLSFSFFPFPKTYWFVILNGFFFPLGPTQFHVRFLKFSSLFQGPGMQNARSVKMNKTQIL